ncbi:MAG: mevalonate kinase [Acidobacteriota bacterium]
MTSVSAPGKLILMGEHAVVYGRPALVAAIDLRLAVRLSGSGEAGVRLDLPGLGVSEQISWAEVRGYARSARDRWDDYSAQPGPESFHEMRGEDPAHVVKAALGEAVEALGEPGGGLELRVDSELPLGSGFGSSAATAVAVVAGFFAWRSAKPDPETVERLALEVERRQHGHPSGVDGATILRGGVLRARKRAAGGLEIEPVRVRSSLLGRLQVYDTGMPPEATGAVVAAVRRRRERDPGWFEEVLDRIEAATAAFQVELEREGEDRDRALHLIRAAQSCLEEIGVVPEAVREAVRQIEGEGGAAKVSGAGSIAGPGAGSLLVYHPDPGRLRACAALRTFPYHAVHLGASGFREEAG